MAELKDTMTVYYWIFIDIQDEGIVRNTRDSNAEAKAEVGVRIGREIRNFTLDEFRTKLGF
jgi:hypothetical protein